MTSTFPSPIADWRDDAACRDADVELFFAHDDASIEAALSFCRTCPVRQECLEYALQAGERYGVWGGTTELERRQLARQRRRVA